MFANLKIGSRRGAGFFLLIALAMLVGLTGIRAMGDSNERVENMYPQELLTIEALDDAKSGMYRIRLPPAAVMTKGKSFRFGNKSPIVQTHKPGI